MQPKIKMPNTYSAPKKAPIWRHFVPANDQSAETAFLPAALEVVETPPSPIGRALIYMICSMFIVALAWSYFGKVDLVATAEGKIIPSGKVKVIQPLEIGVISKINVKEGQHVAAGDVLVEIDPTESRAEAQRTVQELAENKVEAARLSAMAKAGISTDDAQRLFLSTVPKDADTALIERQKALLISSLSQQAALLSGMDSDRAQKEAEYKQVQTEMAKLKETIPLIQGRSDLRQKLVAKGYSSVLEASREQQSLIESEKALTEDEHKLVQAKAAITQLSQQRAEAVAKFSATTLTGLADAERKANDAAQQLIKAKDMASRRTLSSPVDGIVQQLAIHTVGGVVTPAQELMVVVPNDAVLEIEAMIQNKDIGFVQRGQLAEVKLETFPFTRYGLRHGKVVDVSRDSVTPQPQQQNEKVSGTANQQPQQQSSLYTAKISLDQATMEIDGKTVALTPGMAVTAEIKTGRQRIIDYLLDPLRRYRHESFTER